MYTKKFNKDIVQGELGEKIVADFLIKKGYKLLEFSKGKFMDWDIKMLDNKKREITIEVKTDRWEKYNYKTGNIFVETSCSGKPSGVYGSKSDLYAFYFPDFEEIFFITTKELKDKVKTIGYYKSGSGDGARVTGYTVNRYENKEHFKCVKTKYLHLWEE